MIAVEIDDREIRAALNRAIRETGDMRPIMQDIGEYLVETTKRCCCGLHGTGRHLLGAE